MVYDEIKLLRQSEKSTVQLVKEQGSERLFVRKILQGRHQVYAVLRELTHPYLPMVYEVTFEGGSTIVVEEYIEGRTAGSAALTEKQCLVIVRELCDALIFLHGQGIIHRDIKPSNIMIAQDGHIRLIDFDAARMPKENSEQDTVQLGTRGYAPPEQYGFSQTDERADIYALGVTVKQLLGGNAGKRRYQRVFSKCTNLDPDKRYRSVRQVKKAFSVVWDWRAGIACAAAVVLAAVILWNLLPDSMLSQDKPLSGSTELTVLPAPANPHWDGETGIALWGHVPESGVGRDQRYGWRLYRRDTETAPDPEKDEYDREGEMSGNLLTTDYFDMSFSEELWDNGFYYFAVCASGDGVTYADSPYVLSDGFAFTGEDAPRLQTPEGLYWTMKQIGEEKYYFAAISNWDDYEEEDNFDAYVYNEDGEYVMNNTIEMEFMIENGWPGVRIRPEFVNEPGKSYRFAIQVLSSRPNEYRSSLPAEPCPKEAYLSPWLRIPK